MKFQFQQISFFWQFDTVVMVNGLLSAKSLRKALGYQVCYRSSEHMQGTYFLRHFPPKRLFLSFAQNY